MTEDAHHDQIVPLKAHSDGFFACAPNSVPVDAVEIGFGLRLGTIDRVKCLIQKKPNSPRSIHPRGHVLI